MNPAPFAALGDNVLYIAPSGGTLGRTAKALRPRLPDARTMDLTGYDAESWNDIAADRADIVGHLSDHFATAQPSDISSAEETNGEIEGIRYHAFGAGPVLVLTPLAFAPSQWQPLLPELAKSFRVISLSGPHLGMLALLEQRAVLNGWQHMCSGAFDALALSPGDQVLEVGCGSGAITRQFAAHTSSRNPVTAIDLSPYLLGEARSTAASADITGTVNFLEASAEALPFDNATFDAAYTITVLEECDAARALAELVRVVKPGGHIAVVVRGIDLPQWWNLKLSETIRTKISVPAASVSPHGVATAALYDLAIAAGLTPQRMYPYTVASESIHGPVFEFPEAHALALLTPEEQSAYQAARAAAVANGTLFVTRGHHCFIGKVPV